LFEPPLNQQNDATALRDKWLQVHARDVNTFLLATGAQAGNRIYYVFAWDDIQTGPDSGYHFANGKDADFGDRATNVNTLVLEDGFVAQILSHCFERVVIPQP
jgi:hypothetical protein